MIYEAVIKYDSTATPIITIVADTPALNVAVSCTTDHQLVFTHPLLTEESKVQATLCELYDDEICVAINSNNGQASLQVVNAAMQWRNNYKVSVYIKF